MKRKLVKKTSSATKRTKYVSPNPNTNLTTYSGPIVRRIERQAKDTKTIVLTEFVTVASSGAGVINLVQAGNPSTASNWADTNTVWGEYRLLGFTCFFMPFNRYSKTTTNVSPTAVVVDRRNSTALTSLANAAAHASCQMKSLEDPWSITIKMDGEEEANFLAVSSPNAFQWLKFYATGLTISTNYGYLFVSYRVQYRNVE